VTRGSPGAPPRPSRPRSSSARPVSASACLGVGLLGRLVDLPLSRRRALDAAVFLGFGAAIANGLLAARSVWFAEGAGRVLAFAAILAVVVLGALGGLVALGRVAESRY
jgi:hypothetical protein